jgi:polyisoprenoid-binding protein YceI
MRHLLALAGLVLLIAGPANAQEVSSDPASAEAGQYRLDKKHASVTLKLSHLGLSFYTMRFDGVDASYAYDPATPQAARIEVAIKADSIDTGDPAFNAQIASQFFEAARYPAITFRSTAVRPGQGGKGEVVGDLTFHGVTRPITLDVVYNGAGRGMLREERMGFSGIATIRRSEFGVTKFLPLVGDDVTVLIEVEFVKS